MIDRRCGTNLIEPLHSPHDSVMDDAMNQIFKISWNSKIYVFGHFPQTFRNVSCFLWSLSFNFFRLLIIVISMELRINEGCVLLN